MSSPFVWYLSRATGVVSLVLFTAVFVLGMLLAGGRTATGIRSTVLHRLHRSLSLGTLVFLAVHILSALLDGYVSIDWWATIVPFASSYRPLPVALGTVALDLLVAVILTSVLRHRISERVWRLVHPTAYGMWPFAIVHGLVMGTATDPVLRDLSIASAIVGGLGIGWRLVARSTLRSRRAVSEEWS